MKWRMGCFRQRFSRPSLGKAAAGRGFKAADALQLAAALALQQAGLPNLAFASADTRLTIAEEAEGLGVV